MVNDKLLQEIEETLNNSTGDSWYSEQNDYSYDLYADTGEFLHLKILKSPKKSEEHAEYWTNEWDDKLITNSKVWLRQLLQEVRILTPEEKI